MVKLALTVAAMFALTWIGKLSNGATYNPITLLLNSLGGKPQSLFTLAARILAQVLGSLVGVMCVMNTMPRGSQGGPVLKVGVKSGMITEGILTFIIVMVTLVVNRRGPKGFFLKTWILSLSKLCLSILGSNFTGPAMNPATAFGWAYARDQHRTKEHVYVYWLAPLEACILAVWIFQLLVQKKGTREKTKRTKKD
ncbi:hypothetical protein SUGI_1053690 [Cryptomeria japonica]|nr:hypothetical protein SUGI_1053690 [Cryptomeria japonica]